MRLPYQHVHAQLRELRAREPAVWLSQQRAYHHIWDERRHDSRDPQDGHIQHEGLCLCVVSSLSDNEVAMVDMASPNKEISYFTLKTDGALQRPQQYLK